MILFEDLLKITQGGKMKTEFKPGEQAPKTGDYECYDSKCRCGGKVHLEKGERFPATQHEGSHYELTR